MIETGKFVRIIEDRGYGFIAPDADPVNWIFFHAKQYIGEAAPVVGGRCAYERIEGPRGPKAVNVDLLPEYLDAA